MEPGIIVPIAFFAMVTTIAIGTQIVRAFSRGKDREAKAKVAPDVTARLERIEQAVDAIAIEVERISEGQRFTTKLLTERASDASRLTEPRRPS
jgi:hypothetical protein